MLTTEQAAALLSERGITIRQRGKEHPPTARNVEYWCRTGLIVSERIGGPRRGFWIIDADSLDSFVPPKMGAPECATIG